MSQIYFAQADKQHRSRYSSPLLSQALLDEHASSLNKITPYITSPTRTTTIYSSNPNRAPPSKFYAANSQGPLNNGGSATRDG